jgi:hypothetical protein
MVSEGGSLKKAFPAYSKKSEEIESFIFNDLRIPYIHPPLQSK